MSDLAEQFRPCCWGDFVGQESAVKEVRSYLSAINVSFMKPLLFVGRTGTGKTSMAKLVVREIGNEGWMEFILNDAGAFSTPAAMVDRLRSARHLRSDEAKTSTLILDDFHRVRGEVREGLRTELEAIGRSALLIVTTESTRKWSEAILDRFRVIRFADVSMDSAQMLLDSLWCKLGRKGHPPPLAKLGVQSQDGHCSFRRAISDGLEPYLLRGEISPTTTTMPARYRKATLAYEMICQDQGKRLTRAEAYELLSIPERLAELKARDPELACWPLPKFKAFERYTREPSE
ncbi:MAG: AAA family ATPase [Gemmatales bacterium]